MHRLKLIRQGMLRFFKQIRSYPQSVALTFKRRQQQSVLNEQEAERIDRICNPSKYLGK